jgi:hypothetical protein
MSKKYNRFFAVLFFLPVAFSAAAQDQGFKTTLDFTIEKNGGAICEVTNKYTASYWDYWTKAVGNNTSIINNEMKKIFPKYHLSDFNHSQNANERSNTVKFRIDGMMNINKNGKWEADLGSKDPNITKVSNTEFLLIEGTQTMKIHLPSGTSDAKVEKDSFGKAMLTFSPSGGGGMGNITRYAGIALALAGIFLFIRNRKSGEQQTEHKAVREKSRSAINQEISNN